VVILAARSRRHLRGWLVLTLLIAIVTRLVLAAVTAGRRADLLVAGSGAADDAEQPLLVSALQQ
jgi:hypothetical protein